MWQRNEYRSVWLRPAASFYSRAGPILRTSGPGGGEFAAELEWCAGICVYRGLRRLRQEVHAGLTILNMANENVVFATDAPGTQDAATIDAALGSGTIFSDVAHGGGIWTTFNPKTF
jgi:hypothetical protein